MLKETPSARTYDRRWFSDDYFDLIIWYDGNGAITGFQLCYDKGGNERAYTWRRGAGSDHELIDTGESSPLVNMTPVLVPDGMVPYQELMRQFQERSANIDQAIQALVMQTLNNDLSGSNRRTRHP